MRDWRRGAAATRAREKMCIPEVRLLSTRHIAFVLPLILVHLGCGLVVITGASRPALLVFVVSGTIQVFGITAGYHRLLTHRSFRTSRQFQFVLALCGVLAGQNGPLWWVGHHRHHHRHADRDDDAHSPRRGFFWSHMGWLFSPHCVGVRRHLVADLARFRELVLLERYSYAVNLTYALVLYACGEAWRALYNAAGANGLQFVVWGTVVSTVCVYHSVWSANSICHRYGSRRYETSDDSRNNFLVSLVTFGDGWHHNHHACPYAARHGFRRWEIDLNFVILKLLSRLGVVWDLRMPPAPIAADDNDAKVRCGQGNQLPPRGRRATAVASVNGRSPDPRQRRGSAGSGQP